MNTEQLRLLREAVAAEIRAALAENEEDSEGYRGSYGAGDRVVAVRAWKALEATCEEPR